jgi:hypothetical protein
MRNVPWLGLEEEEKIAVLLRLIVVGKEALLELGGFIEVACDLVLLNSRSMFVIAAQDSCTYFL